MVPGFWKGTGHGPGLHQLITESRTMTGPLALSKVLIIFLVATVPLWENNVPLGKKTHEHEPSQTVHRGGKATIHIFLLAPVFPSVKWG